MELKGRWRDEGRKGAVEERLLEDLPPNACFITKSMFPLLLTVDLQIREKWACSH